MKKETIKRIKRDMEKEIIRQKRIKEIKKDIKKKFSNKIKSKYIIDIFLENEIPYNYIGTDDYLMSWMNFMNKQYVNKINYINNKKSPCYIFPEYFDDNNKYVEILSLDTFYYSFENHENYIPLDKIDKINNDLYVKKTFEHNLKIAEKEKKKGCCFLVICSKNDTHINNKLFHANCLFFDFIKKQVYRFEPHGGSAGQSFYDMKKCDVDFKNYFQTLGYSYSPFYENYEVGIQKLDEMNKINNKNLGYSEKHNKFINIGGYCLVWCTLLCHVWFENEDMTLKDAYSLIDNEPDTAFIIASHYANFMDKLHTLSGLHSIESRKFLNEMIYKK